MLGKNLSNMSLEDLQKAVMGGNPAVEPYQALAAIEKMVKNQKAKTAQMAQQQAPQGMVAQRTLAEAAALRNPYMASGLGAAPVASPVTSEMGQAPQQPEQAPQGMAGGGMVSFAKGGTPPSVTPYESGFEALTDDERIEALKKYKATLGAGNAELLAPLEKYQIKYGEDAEKAHKNAGAEALIAAGLGAAAGKSRYFGQNIAEGGLKGLASYQESRKSLQTAQDKMLQSQADMAKAKIALEKGDETTAAALQNQARQEAQAAGQFKLQGEYYANSNAAQKLAAEASMVGAKNRGLGGAGGAFAGDKQQLAELKALQASHIASLKDKSLLMPKNAGRKAAIEADLDRVNKQIAAMAGIGTIAMNSPGAGAAGGNRVIDFNTIGAKSGK